MSDQLAPLLLLITIVVLVWDVVLAGWIASRREAPVIFTNLTSLCGLLVAPALVVALATGTVAGSRTISGISWLLPAIACAFAVQVLFAAVTRLVSVVVAIPILLYDLAVAAVAIGDYLVSQHGTAPLGLQAAVAARDSLLGMAVGRAALVSPFALLVPMIAPAYPARWRLSAVVRAALVLSATVVTTLLVLEWPRGLGAIRSYEPALLVPMQSRPAGDFVIGMRLFPRLDGAPTARTAAADLAMAAVFRPEIVLVVLDADGTRASALDSLSRSLESLRDDSVRIAVALSVDGEPSAEDDRARLAALERVLVRVKPDVVLPALAPPVPSLLRRRAASADWWRRIETEAAVVIARVRPRAQLAWSASRLDVTDSAVYAWASLPASPVRVIGAVSYPSFSGLPAVDARLRTFERWHARALSTGGGRQPHWLMNVGGLAHAHGDAAQLAAIRHALAWGSRRPWIGAAIVGEPADYDGGVGLRAANGRARVALRSVAAAAKAMRDAR